ncbi:uncharacterized protein LOC101235902 [Hydra vulgaris]|uniref:uncharacterized protein LOC101235902 n=1 Tax=Hydra vulgaris TaxID=6087 RepID=UPI001F5F81EB|nr:uncharacterized protein LOC101235902 [Hydra vulgaris]
MFDYEENDESGNQTPQSQFKTDFSFVLVNQALQSVRERFQQTHDVAVVFLFLFNQKSLFQAYKGNTLLLKVQNFHNKMGDIDPFEMEIELKGFIHLALENDEKLKTAIHFLNYINNNYCQEVYPNVAILLCVLLICAVTAVTVERSFSKLKLIKNFHRSTMMQYWLSSLAMLSIESACVRTINCDHLIEVFADSKICQKDLV